MSDELTLTGDLSEIHLPVLLMSLYREKETGVLRVEDGPFLKTLYIRDGNVVFATSSDPDERLGECLLRRGVITVAQYLESARRIAPGRRQGEILVDMGAITPDDLVEGVSQQLYDIIFSLLQSGSGAYSLRLEPFSTEEMITISIPLPVLLFRGMERVTRWSRILPSVGEPETRLRRVAALPSFYQALELTPDQEHVLTLCGDGITISALLDASYLNPFETYRVLWIGVTLGLVEREGSPGQGDAGASWNPERVIEHYNDLFAYAHHALGPHAEAAGREALEIVRPAYPALAEGQEELASYGRMDVDRLLAAQRAIAEAQRPAVLQAFLDEVLYAMAFVAEQRLESSASAAFRSYIQAHGTPS